MVEVTINQEKFRVPAPGVLADVLRLLKIASSDGIAIAVNDEVIPKADWENHILRMNDKVFVIRATQGG
jgi:sulfur carrier protein